MVSFQCEACCDVVKKPKLDQHRLRCQSSFTCIDCSTTFAGPHEYDGHTSCVSEAQKYEKALYKGPKRDGRQNKPTEQQTNNGWGAGSKTYGEYQQRPHQRNGWDIQPRGRWQQRPMGSGGNELPLGRESRMNLTHSKGTPVSEGPKVAQQSLSQSQPITITGGTAPAPPAIELPQHKDANTAAKAERGATSKAVGMEQTQQARKIKVAKKNAQREAKTIAEALNVPQTVEAPGVQESRNTLEGAISPQLGSTKNDKKSKKKDALVLETAKGDKGAVDTSARPVIVPEPVIEEREKSKKRKERDDAIDPQGSTAVDTPDLQVENKKRKKEQGKGKERQKLADSEPMPVGAMPVRADEATKPKERKRDKDGKGKERDEEKAAKKARRAERKLEKVSGSAQSSRYLRSSIVHV